MSAVIITGAGGYIGGMLTKKMVENGVKVIAVLHHLTPENFPKSELITMVKANANDPEDLLMNIPTLEYDAFYHLAWAGVNGSEKANPIVQTNNIKMALNCAYVAKKLSCKKFLCAGTVAERAIESLPHLKKTSDGMLYGTAKYCTHLMLETYCKNIELNFLWMQLSNSYGPTNKTGNLVSYALSELLSGREATFGPAMQLYDLIFIDDLIEAVYKLGMNSNKRNYYFIGSGTPQILKEYLTEIGEACGKPDLIKIGVRSDDGITYEMGMFDVSMLKADIGEYISRSFSEGIRYTIAHY